MQNKNDEKIQQVESMNGLEIIDGKEPQIEEEKFDQSKIEEWYKQLKALYAMKKEYKDVERAKEIALKAEIDPFDRSLGGLASLIENREAHLKIQLLASGFKDKKDKYSINQFKNLPNFTLGAEKPKYEIVDDKVWVDKFSRVKIELQKTELNKHLEEQVSAGNYVIEQNK